MRNSSVFGVFVVVAVLCLTKSSPVWFESVDDFNDEQNENGIDIFLKKLGMSFQKPTYVWEIPEKLLTYPTACEKLNYCAVESAPPAGKYRRHPIFPWWYYSCHEKTVECHSCQKKLDVDQPTLFFSERCQKCISSYEENVNCSKQKIRFEK